MENKRNIIQKCSLKIRKFNQQFRILWISHGGGFPMELEQIGKNDKKALSFENLPNSGFCVSMKDWKIQRVRLFWAFVAISTQIQNLDPNKALISKHFSLFTLPTPVLIDQKWTRGWNFLSHLIAFIHLIQEYKF